MENIKKRKFLTFYHFTSLHGIHQIRFTQTNLNVHKYAKQNHCSEMILGCSVAVSKIETEQTHTHIHTYIHSNNK